MKNNCQPGDIRQYSITVTTADQAMFPAVDGQEGGGHIHPVYATFALARDAEWACRLFVLDMKEDDEEGIGIKVTVDHKSPALVGSTVVFTATLQSATGNTVVCTYTAHVGDRLIAEGEQVQKILKKDRVQQLYQPV